MYAYVHIPRAELTPHFPVSGTFEPKAPVRIPEQIPSCGVGSREVSIGWVPPAPCLHGALLIFMVRFGGRARCDE